MWGFKTEQEKHKIRSRGRFNQAIRRGKITKKPCVVGFGCSGSVQGHHEDYNKPFDVIWACTRHHSNHHYGELDLNDFVNGALEAYPETGIERNDLQDSDVQSEVSGDSKAQPEAQRKDNL